MLVHWPASPDGASWSSSSSREPMRRYRGRQHDRVCPCRPSVLVVYHIVGRVDGKDDVGADTVSQRSVSAATPATLREVPHPHPQIYWVSSSEICHRRVGVVCGSPSRTTPPRW